MIVLDTTILVYAVGADHPLAEPCRSLVEAIRLGNLSATTTVEVIQEFAHVRARRRGRADAAALARDFKDLLSPLLVVAEEALVSGLKLFERTELGAFDAVLAAATIQAKAVGLASSDVAFDGVGGLTWYQPGTPAFEELHSE